LNNNECNHDLKIHGSTINMKKNLINKRLLILGGNPETKALVEVANELGVFTIVVDPNHLAPAKKIASISMDVDGMESETIIRIAKDHNVDGILVGVADILVPTYQKVCEALSFPCYATANIVSSFSSKDNFILACKNYNIPTIPTYDIENISNIPLPVIIKPVDNGGGVGITVCKTRSEVVNGINTALNFSLKKRIIIERYMDCDDLFVYYNFIDGKAYLTALADRFTSKLNKTGSPVSVGHRYPSKHLQNFEKNIHPKLINMFSGLGIKNGVLGLQFFYDGIDFYSYDPGFRLQGEGTHLHLLAANGFDNRVMLINFALTGSIYTGNFDSVNDVRFNQNYAATVWVLLDQGIIKTIDGIDKIKILSSFKFLLQRFYPGDEVSEEMLGTEKQVLCRIYLQNINNELLRSDINSISINLLVKSIDGDSMIIDMLDMHDNSDMKLN
jgi:biotin carboxylase